MSVKWRECPWCGKTSSVVEQGHSYCVDRVQRLWDETFARGMVDHGQAGHAKDEADKALDFLRKSHGLWRA